MFLNNMAKQFHQLNCFMLPIRGSSQIFTFFSNGRAGYLWPNNPRDELSEFN